MAEQTITPIDYNQVMLREYRAIVRGLKNVSRADKVMVRKAFEFARDAHDGVKRKSGEPYILHPLAVAKIIVLEMGLEDPVAVACAFLHDVVEDTDIELDEIERRFGQKAREIIDGLTKIPRSAFFDELNSEQAENFRKVLMTISDDIRVVLIKLADRLHNMRTLGAMRREKMLKIASETLYIYAPLAHRLGLYETKTELEDLAFKYSEPSQYAEIAAKIQASREDAQNYIDRFIRGIRQRMKLSELKFTLKSRFKSVFSIYNKMQRKNLPFEQIYDRYAIRIILESREGKERDDCWYVYSLISGLYRPNPKRLRDWITVPKDNHYESLHTTLMGPDGRWVEVQIRTTRMDAIAEKGVAAHWKYKENGKVDDEFLTEWISQIREILANPQLNALEALREFKENLQPNDVFVFTPQGEMKRLQRGASALDFAYKIHSKIGEQAIGAKINNHVVTLDYVLKPGDQVEILTSQKSKPKKSWLRFARTARARGQIKSFLRRERNDIITQGRHLFLWRARQYDIDEQHPYMKELLAYFMMPSVEDFYHALGSRQIDTAKIPEFIRLKKEGKEVDQRYIEEWENRQQWMKARLQEFGVNADMLVLGKEQDIDHYVLGKCCNPIPGDDILGFVEGKKLTIHRPSCEKAIGLMSSFGSQIVRARWAGDHSDISFLAGLKVVGLDKMGMLNDLIRIISLQKKLNIQKVTIESREGMFEGFFHIYVNRSEELESVINRIEQHQHVFSVSRYDEQPQDENEEEFK
jgi:guanosine-3',5'-bis(diphosphate) 3'-pyrophosphohydrolase